MRPKFGTISRKVDRLDELVKVHQKLVLNKVKLYNGKPLAEYREDPEGYARHVLKLKQGLTPDQLEICKKFRTYPYRVICRAAHVVGKSFLAAFIVSWIYDTREHCYIITTAPTLKQVKNAVWRELRKMRRAAGLGGFTGPRAIQMQDSESHLAVGQTATNSTSFQGSHEVAVFIIIDEAAAVLPEFWEAIETMLSGEEYGLFAILNPTTTSCQAYREEKEVGIDGKPRNHIHVISALNHPNIAAELAGEKPPYPAAVRLATLWTWITKWCDKIEADDATETDFEFPPASGRWWRPGPIGEARILGRYPSRGVNTIWSEALFKKCIGNALPILTHYKTAIGCDVARYGDDMTSIFVRRGPCVVWWETHSGWDGAKIAGRLKMLSRMFPGPQEPERVQIYVDETGGWGTGVIDNADGWNFIGVNSGCRSRRPDLYLGIRTELWCVTVEIARIDMMDLSRLPQECLIELERQLKAQKYEIQANGALWVVSKDEVKKELGRSPDDADALNLCFLEDYNPAEQSQEVVR